MRVYHPPPQPAPTDNIFTYQAGEPPNMGPNHPNNQLPGFSAAFGGLDSRMIPQGPGQNQYTYPPPLPPPSYPTPARQHIDPSLMDYDNEDDEDEFPPVSTLLEHAAKPAKKIAGSRRTSTVITTAKAKGKARAIDNTGPLKRGRQQGAPNYNEDDIDALLDACESCLPVGAKSWNIVEATFARWANDNDRPARSSKSLELKFKQFVRTTKPTGDAECPPYIDRAHYIDTLINEKAGTRDLDDEELADEVVEISDDDDDDDPTVSALSKTKPTQIKHEAQEPRLGPAARRATSPVISRPPRTSRSAGVDLLATISASLDPRLQAVRDEDRSARAIQSTQVMSLTTQLRDAHATVNKLHGQLAQVERERANAERRADRLEMQLEMAKFMQDSRSGHQQQERVRRETIYRDGGRSTIWVTPDEAGDDFGLDDHDVVSRRDIVEDQRVGRYTRAIVPRVPMTPRTSATPRASATPASGPSSARLDVSFTPTSITISPSHGRESKGPNEID
ncbi:hypothetical protein DEU56DRAFT_944770 [Suillus clintonianus]|uniref:uncharacterized protein n=1 Tax=Suillus clintonianus TaxID=1904413 RepID=UPI001B87F88E|nr:uncharacterized protein DEU56DRAFT_944770 [Suillus clintonianus]KAG2138461.1 hypothetical protein DEU56DRAFT_944770 [Suillus clintonianus]